MKTDAKVYGSCYYLELCHECEGKGVLVCLDGRVDEGDIEHLPLGPAASKLPEVVAQGQHEGYHLK